MAVPHLRTEVALKIATWKATKILYGLLPLRVQLILTLQKKVVIAGSPISGCTAAMPVFSKDIIIGTACYVQREPRLAPGPITLACPGFKDLRISGAMARPFARAHCFRRA
jgi:hypothetical protein